MMFDVCSMHLNLDLYVRPHTRYRFFRSMKTKGNGPKSDGIEGKSEEGVWNSKERIVLPFG